MGARLPVEMLAMTMPASADCGESARNPALGPTAAGRLRASAAALRKR